MSKTTLVIPTIRNLDFLQKWRSQLQEVDIIICEDNPSKTIQVPTKIGATLSHYSWTEIDAELGEKSWIIPRHVSGIRNFGFWKAYQNGAEIIVTLDDDCYPVKHHLLIAQHTQNLNQSIPQQWVNTYPDRRHLYTRGMPYSNRQEAQVMLSHGVWTYILDHDGETHKQNESFRATFAEHFLQIIPRGTYFPMCSMNLAFRREITPIMYFPLMGENRQGQKWGYDRFDDIWAGIFAKKILDHLGLGVVNGSPFVEHRKASDPLVNIKKEAAGIKMNETLWKLVDNVKLQSTNPKNCYIELAQKIAFPSTEYFNALRKAMLIWADLF